MLHNEMEIGAFN